MKVWLPTLRAGSGADVFSLRLQRALLQEGVTAEIAWLPSSIEWLPERLRTLEIPAGVDIVHANALVAGQFMGRGVPVVATVHHLVHDKAYAPHRSIPESIYHRMHLRWRERRAIRKASAVTAVSRHVAQSIRTVFARADIDVVPNWVDCELYLPAIASQPLSEADAFRVLWVGNRSRRKGVDLLPALARALGPGYEVRCVGGLRSGTSPADEIPGVRMLGGLTEAQLVSEYQACDVLVSLSRYEGFGYAALEAMACGKPVVAFAAGGLTEVVEDNVTGFLCDVDDVAALAGRVAQLAADRCLLHRMGSAARDRACSHAGNVNGYLRVYERVMRSTMHS